MKATFYQMNAAWNSYRDAQKQGNWKAADTAFEQYEHLRDLYEDEGGIL